MSNSFVECVEQAQVALLASDSIGATFGRLDDHQLREAIQALDSLTNSAQALQAAAIAEVGRRARRADDAEAARVGFHGPNSCEEFIVDELAVLLSCTTSAASYLYDRAMRTAASPSVMRAWGEGRIDARKAESIAHTYAVCGQSLSDNELATLVDASIDYASRRTGPQLREWLRRREISLDPAAADRRRQRAREERRVVIRHVDDGMSELWALLPSVYGRAIQQILDQVARESSSTDGRSMENRRADALIELITGEIEPPQTQIQVVVPADVLAGGSDQPGWLPGVGPVTAQEVRELAAARGDRPASDRTLFRRLLADPSTGRLVDVAERQYRPSSALDRAVRARDVTCRFPGCRRAALGLGTGTGTGTDLDHTVPWPQGATSADNLAVLCRRHHRLKHSPGWSVTLERDGSMTWITPTGRSYTSEPWQYIEPTGQGPAPPQLE